MSSRTRKFRRLTTARRTIPAWVGPLAAVILAGGRAAANPQGMTVAGGTVSAVANGNNLNITASHNAVINWSSFNIGAGETTTFHQPGVTSVVWNRIGDTSPSQIWGNLNANGIVVLMNQSGFYFGPNSSINVGGFIATTSPVNPPLPAGAPVWAQPPSPPLASIVNYGSVNVANGGSLFLVAEKIINHGVLMAPDGTLGLYAGKELLLSERPDGRGLSASVALPDGVVDNQGKLMADGGQIAVHARVVNQGGVIQADSVRNQNGVIELVASDEVNLGANSLIQANGDSGTSAGGTVSIKSAGSFSDVDGSRIEVRGGTAGGNGGAAEVSAFALGDVHSRIDGSAAQGFRGGHLLFDPYDLTLNSGSLAGDVGMSAITIAADHDIELAQSTTLNLAGATGVTDPGSLFTLQAGNNIIFDDYASIQAGSGWSVSLMAGVDFSHPTPVVQPGVGGIYFNYLNSGTTGIETTDGNLTLHAGNEIQLGYTYLRSVAGGNLSITADAGDVNAGVDPDNYDYLGDGTYNILGTGNGGIGTTHGGNVTVHAGHDIVATSSSIGAFGPEGDTPTGNVELVAGNDVFGSFYLRNGIGTIHAGNNVGSASATTRLALSTGGWNAIAARDIFLNEVFNPNGSLNGNQSSGGLPFQSDYAADAQVSLIAGNGVTLTGRGLAALENSRPVYAPILNILAGAGGVTLGNDLVLYPSALSHLSITTTDHGSLASSPGEYFRLVMSDSGSLDYHDFLDGHAVVPVHFGQSGTVMDLEIDGDLQNIAIQSPGSAFIHVRGNAPSISFLGQNLSAGDVTTIQIDGDYASRNTQDTDFVTIPAADTAAFGTAFNRIFLDANQVINTGLASRLTYDPTTGRLTLIGRLSPDDLTFLLHPLRYNYANGVGLSLDQTGNPAIFSDSFSSDPAVPQILQALQNLALLNIPTSSLANTGLQIGGPGLFKVSAASMNLGISSGIRSVGTLLNSQLAQVSASGANVSLDLAGDLDMTSSQIASFNGGSIAIHAGGHLNVGGQDTRTSDSTPKGIYTGHGGSVYVDAGGDVNVSGSRIASYDGGDITVISEHGAVDAGDGARGFFYVTTSEIDPITGLIGQRNDRFFGSGICAFTSVDSDARVGDITVQAHGDVVANTGGILQLAFNDFDQTGARVSVVSDAGSIFAGQSGVLGVNLHVAADHGSIDGVFVAVGNADIHAANNVNVTALAGGTATVSGGGTVSGTVVGGAGASVSGSEISASVISTGGSASANGSESSGSAFAGVAPASAQKTTDDASASLEKKSLADNTGEEDEKKKKRGGKPGLAHRVSRVTVILPTRK